MSTFSWPQWLFIAWVVLNFIAGCHLDGKPRLGVYSIGDRTLHLIFMTWLVWMMGGFEH